VSARAGGALTLAAAGLLAAGCTVGSGSGSAVGMLMDVGCNSSNSFRTLQPYSLQPSFFAGQPTEDVCPPPGQCSGPHTNQLIIRMQRTGNRVEVNDVLYFYVNDSRKVAQCIRGQTMNGVPQWDTRLVTDDQGAPIPGLSWCDWNAADADGGAPDGGGAPDAGAGPDGGVVMTAARARINLSTQDLVQAFLAPLYTCVEARSVGISMPGSWIEFQDFGSADQSSITDPEMRDGIPDDFAVNFGERLRATFHLVLGDQAVEYAIKTRSFVPDLRIQGTLDGSFDFDLERGRAAQPFP
jgi:hypothetical protein